MQTRCSESVLLENNVVHSNLLLVFLFINCCGDIGASVDSGKQTEEDQSVKVPTHSLTKTKTHYYSLSLPITHSLTKTHYYSLLITHITHYYSTTSLTITHYYSLFLTHYYYSLIYYSLTYSLTYLHFITSFH